MSVQTAPLHSIRLQSSYIRAKRLLDVVFTLLIALPLLLICAIVALMIVVDSKGPIIFRQKRVGRNGKEFEMLKFRSMHVHSDDSYHRNAIARYMNGEKLADSAEAPYKTHDDPRVTRIGKVIRSCSLDELPQFWNILKGEMSLVGPRPPLPYEVELYSARDRLRLEGYPGLTGPWQVYGRSRVPFAEMITMDLDYLQKQSVSEDLKILLLTVPVVVQRRGGA